MTTGANNHVITAMGIADPDCPDDTDAVGVGMDPTTFAGIAKLNVRNNSVFGEYNGATNSKIAGYFNSTGTGYGVNVGTYSLTTNYSVRSRAVIGETDGLAEWTAYGGDFIARDNAFYTVGAQGITFKGQSQSIGLEGNSWSEARYNHGVYGSSHGRFISPGAPTHPPGSNNPTSVHYGVRGFASKQLEGQKAYGLHGTAATGLSDSYAVYSNGDQFSTTMGTWTTSDEQLKTNVTELESALEKILALTPKQYEFNHDAAPQIFLSHGVQYGFIAQELEEVMPDLVRQVSIPAELDSLGNEIYAAAELRAVNYDLLLPFLVGAIKEQQLRIEAQQVQLEEQETLLSDQLAALTNEQEILDRLDQLEHLLALCCQAPPSDVEPRNSMINDGTGLQDERILRIQPNPFTDHTTLYYQLERGGRVQLMANSSDGKQLRVLQEAQLEARQYQYEWHTSDLAPGIYYVTLLLDGEPLVKRAVKVR